jgi:uncharacterized protein DUF6599
MKRFVVLLLLLIFFTTITFSSEINFSQIKNWTAADTIDQYDFSNLWEYINGAADLFIMYGFQNLHSCEMSSSDIEVVVDVYNMGNRLNAFGMYKTERGDIKDKLNIGVEAVITSPNQSLMLKDIYYIKVNVYEGELSSEKNQSLLGSIAEFLPGSNEFPTEFELLPSENKIENTENFAKEGYLGLSELTNCLYAEYETKDDSNFQYFVILPETNESHESIWNNFSEKWKKLDSPNTPILFRKIPYKGMVGIIKTDTGILGVIDSNTESELEERLLKFNNK